VGITRCLRFFLGRLRSCSVAATWNAFEHSQNWHARSRNANNDQHPIGRAGHQFSTIKHSSHAGISNIANYSEYRDQCHAPVAAGEIRKAATISARPATDDSSAPKHGHKIQPPLRESRQKSRISNQCLTAIPVADEFVSSPCEPAECGQFTDQRIAATWWGVDVALANISDHHGTDRGPLKFSTLLNRPTRKLAPPVRTGGVSVESLFRHPPSCRFSGDAPGFHRRVRARTRPVRSMTRQAAEPFRCTEDSSNGRSSIRLAYRRDRVRRCFACDHGLALSLRGFPIAPSRHRRSTPTRSKREHPLASIERNRRVWASERSAMLLVSPADHEWKPAARTTRDVKRGTEHRRWRPFRESPLDRGRRVHQTAYRCDRRGPQNRPQQTSATIVAGC